MLDATPTTAFARPDLTTFCRLDELGATAIRVDPGDVDGLLRAAAAFLQADGVEALAEATRRS